MIACGSILGMPSLHSLKVGGVAGQKYWHGHGRVSRAVSYGLVRGPKKVQKLVAEKPFSIKRCRDG